MLIVPSSPPPPSCSSSIVIPLVLGVPPPARESKSLRCERELATTYYRTVLRFRSGHGTRQAAHESRRMEMDRRASASHANRTRPSQAAATLPRRVIAQQTDT